MLCVGHVGSLNWHIHTQSDLADHSPLPPSAKSCLSKYSSKGNFKHPCQYIVQYVQSSRYGRRSQGRNHYFRARYTEGKIVYIVGRVDEESEAGGYLVKLCGDAQ